jgi:Leucine-rich repeat (LRR) protein
MENIANGLCASGDEIQTPTFKLIVMNRQISIRLDPVHTSCPDYLAGFFRKVGIELSHASQGAICEIGPNSTCEFNLLRFYPGSELLESNEWLISGSEIPGGHLLVINRQTIAASLQSLRGPVSPEGYPTYYTKVPLDQFVTSLPKSIRHLSLYSCASMTDLTPISTLAELRSLHLGYCTGVNDLEPISGLIHLESLDLSDCDWLQDLQVISNLKSLRRLVLDRAESLADLSALSSFHSLEHLDLQSCRMLSDLSPLRSCLSLRYLHLYGCRKITDFSPIARLTNLQNLDISGHGNFNDLSPLSNLTELTDLNISRSSMWGTPPSPKDLSPLVPLKKLRFLRVEEWDYLEDLSALREMNDLEDLSLKKASNLTDLSPLEGLPSLKMIGISGCKSLKDLSPLTKLPALKSMSWGEGSADLSGCEALEDLKPLTKLQWIKELDLRNCKSVRDMAALAVLTKLEELKLEGCTMVSDITPLANNQKIRKLNLMGLKRLKSLVPIRDLRELRKVECDFHPGVVAEVIAHAAISRGDLKMIREQGGAWVKEAQNYERDQDSALESLMTTLCGAFSFLGEDKLVLPTEMLLDRHPEFSSAPWKAWFGGTLSSSGIDLYRKRVERVSVIKMSVGAIGGACSTLPDSESAWSIQWLAELDKDHSGNAKELLPVAPEICLAYARFGEMEALGRWLERLTDPSDPGALDTLHAQFAQWQLGQGNTLEALNHIAAINSLSVSDPLYAALSIHWLKDAPVKSGEVLLMIESPLIRRETGVKLATDEGFTKSPENIHRLIASVGYSASSLAAILKALGNRADSALIQELSESLQLAENDFKARYIARLEALLKKARSL